MSLAFSAGAPAVGGSVARQALRGFDQPAPGLPAAGGAALPLGASPAPNGPSASTLASGAVAGIALVGGSRGLRRQVRKQRQAEVARRAVLTRPATDEETEFLPSRAMTADGSISLGQPVTWNGKSGIARWIGSVRFADGEWIGVELSEAAGMHNGNVLGVPYFECADKHAVFAQVAQLQVSGAAPAAPAPSSTPAAGGASAGPVVKLGCAMAADVAFDKLISKGPRADADKGTPTAASLPIFKHEEASFGAWSCTPGGFPVPGRKTTEIMYIIEGEGFLTDADGTPHCFRAGDLVVLPKGWSGRWDILKTVRKVWGVNNHAADLTPEESRRAFVSPPQDVEWSQLESKGPRKADWSDPEDFSKPLWKAGPTSVGSWACTAGGFKGTSNRPTTEWFYILEGVAFLTNLDGSAVRVGAGDTIILPKGWSGRWDIIEPIRKVWALIH